MSSRARLLASMLAALALPLLAGEAFAYRIFFDNNRLDGDGDDLRQLVDVRLDTQGESNIKLFEYGVNFSTSYLAYDRDRSFTGGSPSPYPGYPNYILYGSVPVGRAIVAAYMEPRVPVPGGFTYDPPRLILPSQVHGGWVEVNLGATVATASNLTLGTLAFQKVDDVPQGAELSLTLTEGGTVFQLGDNSIISDEVELGPNVPVLLGDPPAPQCVLEQTVSFDAPTLSIEYVLATKDPALWMIYGVTALGPAVYPLWIQILPPIDPTPVGPASWNAPPVGEVGFFSFIKSAGVDDACWDWDVIDTGSAP